jgi:hypothetical protein
MHHPYAPYAPYPPMMGADASAHVLEMSCYLIFFGLMTILFLWVLFSMLGKLWGIWKNDPRKQNRREDNPFENWEPEPKPKKASKYLTVSYAEEAATEAAQKVRSPVRLLYAAAFERLTDEELDELRSRAPDAIQRLKRATVLMAACETKEAENLCFVARGMVRRTFGEGQHWLEAVIVSDLAALSHFGNRAEDAEYFFARAAAIGEPWFARYPWLRGMCTKRRLVRG